MSRQDFTFCDYSLLQKRRSARNTKRKKYLDELDLDISEDEDDEEGPLVKVGKMVSWKSISL